MIALAFYKIMLTEVQKMNSRGGDQQVGCQSNSEGRSKGPKDEKTASVGKNPACPRLTERGISHRVQMSWLGEGKCQDDRGSVPGGRCQTQHSITS